jgi:hypothetical protein
MPTINTLYCRPYFIKLSHSYSLLGRKLVAFSIVTPFAVQYHYQYLTCIGENLHYKKNTDESSGRLLSSFNKIITNRFHFL